MTLIGLPTEVDVDGFTRTFGSFDRAKDVAHRYMARAGLPYSPITTYKPVDPERAARIAAEYDRMLDDATRPDVRRSYRALIDETLAQYRAIVESGMRFEFAQGVPYPTNPRLAILDIVGSSHLYVYSTLQGGYGNAPGSDDKARLDPLKVMTDVDFGGIPACANDVFRAVHDYFGHAMEGIGFRANGEENAWRSHSAMYSPLALGAMTSELRGQNSWLNYGPYGESNRTAKAEDTVYADQKTGLLPQWCWNEGRLD